MKEKEYKLSNQNQLRIDRMMKEGMELLDSVLKEEGHNNLDGEGRRRGKLKDELAGDIRKLKGSTIYIYQKQQREQSISQQELQLGSLVQGPTTATYLVSQLDH